EEGVVQDVVGIHGVARREVAHRGRHACRRPLQPLTVGVLAQLLEHLLDLPLDRVALGLGHQASPRYSNRFFAVSSTATRRKHPTGGAVCAAGQRPRTTPSPVVITPASGGACSSWWWSTCSRIEAATVRSTASRSTANPVCRSGTPAMVTSR